MFDGIRMNGNFAEVVAKYDITPSMAYNWCVDLENKSVSPQGSGLATGDPKIPLRFCQYGFAVLARE